MKNRTDLKADIAAWTATLDLEATHKPDVTELIDSVISRIDNTDAGTVDADPFAIDYDDVDYYACTLRADASNVISFTNITQGEVKWLLIDNTADEPWSFSGVVDETISQDAIESLSVAFYMVYNKDGNIHVKPMSKDLVAATTTQAQTGTDDEAYMTAETTKYVTRHGHKILSNAESYTLADGVGYVEIPSGVSGGTIQVGNPATVPVGRRVVVYSSGGSGVSITTVGSIISGFVANYIYEGINNGSSWVTLRYESRT